MTADTPNEASRRGATAAAQQAFQAFPGVAPGLRAGDPTLVRTPRGEPSYWLVPGTADAGIAAMVRILLDGRVATVAAMPQHPTDVAEAATGLSTVGAQQLGQTLAARHPTAPTPEPCLVHDGPVGREAWLFPIALAGQDALWVFATGGGTYQRIAETPPASPT